MDRNSFAFATERFPAAVLRMLTAVMCICVVLASVGCAAKTTDHTTGSVPVTTMAQEITIPVTTTEIRQGTQRPGTVTNPVSNPTTLPVPTDSPVTTAPTTPPEPTEPKPTEPVPTTPKPTEPKPTEPKPTEPKPTEPKPTEPKPTEPKPTEPKPTEPKPTEPRPTEPKPTEPVPADPMDAWSGDYSNQKHTKLAYTKRYMYNQLDEDLKLAYRKIDEAVRNLEPSVYFDEPAVREDWDYAYYMYMMDNPEHFYLGNSIAVSTGDGRVGFLFSYSDGATSCGYGLEQEEIDDALRTSIRAKKAKFDAEVERIISKIPSNAPDVIKERMVYDLIVRESYYNTSAVWSGVAPDDWTAYGILNDRKGVCEAYSEAFQTLCYAMGINCTGIIGYAGEDHKWNAVQLDGDWYLCDITFDDPINGGEGMVYHQFFNLTTEDMLQKEHFAGDQFPGPNCTATKYSYTNYFGED